MIQKCFDKNSAGGGASIPLEFNKELAKELHKPIIRTFKRRKVYSGFIDNVWSADLADM